MAATSKSPSLDASHFAGKSRARKCLFLGNEAINSWAPAAIQAGFGVFNLPFELEASTAKSMEEVDERIREGDVCGGFVDPEQSGYMVAEAEYVNEEDEEPMAANVVVKDEFSDLHVYNTYSTVYSKLLTPYLRSKTDTFAVILGKTSFTKIASSELEKFGVDSFVWDHKEPESLDLSIVPFAAVAIIINALPNDIDPPALPAVAFRPDTLVIDNRTDATENSLVSAAKAGNSPVVTGLEFHFEAVILAFHTFLAPLGRPSKIVPAAVQAMAGALVRQLGGEREKQPPKMIADHLQGLSS